MSRIIGRMDVRDCNACGATRPLADFARDSRNRLGVRGVCKPCERKATNERRANERIGRRPGALVLVPKFPAPPEDSPPPADSPTPGAISRGAGISTYTDAAEAFLAALDPPAGDADALLVRSLRGLADLADQWAYKVMPDEKLTALVASMVRVQRELAATRLAKAKPVAEATTPSRRSAANY